MAASSTHAVVAAAQMTSTSDVSRNLATARELAAEAHKAGARLISFPECVGFLGERERDKFPHAENLRSDADGPILSALREVATSHQMWVSAGGIAERIEGRESADSDSITSAYNTHIVISPAGELVAKYRKIHLFDVDIPGKATLRESDNTTAGKEIVSVETDVGVLGLTICYDLRFPELFRTLACRRGAEILLVPAAFTAHTGAAHWHTLLRARAIENQCFVVAAAQVGRHNPKRESYGHSLIIDPWGTILAECESGTGLAIAEIDLTAVAETRSRMPCHSHQVLGFT